MNRIASLVETNDLSKSLTFEINLTNIVKGYESARQGIGALLEKT
jgi:hypothetical protein